MEAEYPRGKAKTRTPERCLALAVQEKRNPCGFSTASCCSDVELLFKASETGGDLEDNSEEELVEEASPQRGCL